MSILQVKRWNEIINGWQDHNRSDGVKILLQYSLHPNTPSFPLLWFHLQCFSVLQLKLCKELNGNKKQISSQKKKLIYKIL